MTATTSNKLRRLAAVLQVDPEEMIPFHGYEDVEPASDWYEVDSMGWVLDHMIEEHRFDSCIEFRPHGRPDDSGFVLHIVTPQGFQYWQTTFDVSAVLNRIGLRSRDDSLRLRYAQISNRRYRERVVKERLAAKQSEDGAP